jgi:hypothetical protein
MTLGPFARGPPGAGRSSAPTARRQACHPKGAGPPRRAQRWDRDERWQPSLRARMIAGSRSEAPGRSALASLDRPGATHVGLPGSARCASPGGALGMPAPTSKRGAAMARVRRAALRTRSDDLKLIAETLPIATEQKPVGDIAPPRRTEASRVRGESDSGARRGRPGYRPVPGSPHRAGVAVDDHVAPAFKPADCRHDAPARFRVPTSGSGRDVARSRR